MNKITLSLAVMAIAVASCQKPEAVLPVAEQFTATVESFESPTKTSMTPEKYVVWSQNDRLAIFQGGTVAYEYKVNEASAGTVNGTFSRVISSDENDFVAGTELPCNVAFYPYAADLTLTGATLEDKGAAYSIEGVVLPAEQTYSAGSFGNGSFPMAAVTENLEDHTLIFKNVLGALKLQLKGTQIVKSIKVTGKNNEILSGAAVVTAYTNNLAPAITMTSTDEASRSVTLNCGDGIQLSEGTATEFIIALPPVLFNQGFTVIVIDSENATYTVETDKANTVLRSSILAMPAFTLGQEPGDGEDENIKYVEYVFLNMSSLTMMPNTEYTLVADIDPVDVTDPTLTWVSSDNTVASVDVNGVVTAKSDGDVTITVVAVGGESASCQVKVRSAKVFAAEEYIDYVDELGKNYGKGVAVGGVIWAPVNCGYEPASGDYKGYPYGKLYQWGRKYGQGYEEHRGDLNDATYPSGENFVEGPVMPSWGSSEIYRDAFFYGSYDWCFTQIDDLWRSSDGKKTEKDPCPAGWRVPTYDELSQLSSNYKWDTNDGQNGAYFVGEYTYVEGLPQVFFPTAGDRNDDGNANYRGYGGYYWSSIPNNGSAYYLNFNSGHAYMHGSYRAYGYSVRCVQVTDEVAEL